MLYLGSDLKTHSYEQRLTVSTEVQWSGQTLGLHNNQSIFLLDCTTSWLKHLKYVNSSRHFHLYTILYISKMIICFFWHLNSKTKANFALSTTSGPPKATVTPLWAHQRTTSTIIGNINQLTLGSRWSHGDNSGRFLQDPLENSWSNTDFTKR